MYTYNEETKEVERVEMPKLTAEEGKKLEEMEVPKEFLNKIMDMKLTVIK